VQHSVAVDIGDEVAGPRKETPVFRSIDRLSDQQFCGHVHG
jgi:hypothetical protein